MPVASRPRATDAPLSLGPASRLLGVDPDTLRRWADEGRIDSFTTAGGHRRFERATLERILQARRHDATLRLATLGATTDRLSRAYRRGYSDGAGAGDSATPSRPPIAKPSGTTAGRLVAALLAHLDAVDEEDREQAEREAVGATDALATRVAAAGISLADAVTLFVAARRPFLRSSGRSPAGALSIPTGSAGSTTGRRGSWTGCSSVSSRPTRRHRPDMPAGSIQALTSLLAFVMALALLDQWRERRAAVPARLGGRDAVLRDRLGLRGDRRGERLERGALPDLVPDRRDLDGRLARARDGVPPRPDAVRLHVRGLPAARRRVHAPDPEEVRLPGRGQRRRSST